MSVQPGGQGLNPPAAQQQIGGYTLIPANPAAGQPTLTNLRQQPVQIVQQPAPAPPKTQQARTECVGGVLCCSLLGWCWSGEFSAGSRTAATASAATSSADAGRDQMGGVVG